MDNTKLAELLFPDVKMTPEQLEDLYPKRDLPEGAIVSRMAPSPTGFVHLGNLVQGLTSERLAHQSGVAPAPMRCARWSMRCPSSAGRNGFIRRLRRCGGPQRRRRLCAPPPVKRPAYRRVGSGGAAPMHFLRRQKRPPQPR